MCATIIDASLVDDPGALVRDGGYIRDGFDAEIDDLRRISRSGKQVIAELEERERARTGINSLKVRYNRVFGYYIEISKSNLHAVPPDYHRKQTIAGGERFITPALKEYEEKVLGADERILDREVELFEQLRARVAAESTRIQETARALAALDVLAGLAETAALSNYIKPHVHDGDEMAVVDGRHPVVERRCNGAFVPNDTTLDGTASQLVILTGPNMGGKSTYLRQTALICLMAQSGSFVPAARAKIGIVDRIYARVGASDNITRGTVHVHGRDAGDGEHSARRDVPQPHRARRNRPRHSDVRRPQHRVGGCRAPGDQPARPTQDTLCDALSRADRSRRRAARGRQRPRCRPRMAGRHRLPAQDRARAFRSQLRHSSGAAGRHARSGHHARPRDSRGARARRIDARRPPVD